MSRWTLDEGVAFCRALNVVTLRAGFFVGLTGGVLFRGESSKDLDVLVVPMSTAQVDLGLLRQELYAFGMWLRCSREFVQSQWRLRAADNGDDKHVEMWKAPQAWGWRRVDMIFVK